MKELPQQRWQQIDILFKAALEQTPAERRAFLQGMCGTDTDLLNHIENLLHLHDEARGILGDSVATFASPLIPDLIDQISGSFATEHEGPGSTIGSYKILEEIGRGGMGTVWLAKKNDAPYEKQVALKLVRRGMDSQDVLSRFRHEGQILASLEHPNIARLYDGGAHTDGRPYFVMEYIKGEPIDVFCDKHKLSVKERLKLFITVCEAVHYAHQKLIVHRDIKPPHVLVAQNGKINLVDFGIAKLLEPALLRAMDYHTRTGVNMMTPEFAAPEQIRGEPVTTASDIYSLGVLLYLLLTGRRPYRLGTASMLEVERIVCETDLVRPSDAVTGKPLPSPADAEAETYDSSVIALLRGKDAGNLRRELSGDLDRIILMALRKEPERRYRSALGLAEDLNNYLQAKPVQARPSTLRYRAGKFVRRNRWAASAAAVAAVSILTGFGIALWQANVATLERDIAQREAAKARAVQDYLVELFKSADPTENRGEHITVHEIVQRGIANLEENLGTEPDVHIEMLKVLGRVEQALGDFDLSTELLEEALSKTREIRGDIHPDVAMAAAMLGEVLNWNGGFDRAETLLREALAIRNRFIEGDNPEIASNMDQLARAVEMQGDFEEAENLYRNALAMHERLFGEDSNAVSANLNNLGWLLHQMGRENEAEEALRRSLSIKERILEPPHPALASNMSNLAVVQRAKGNYDEAGHYFVQALEQERKLYGQDHPRVTTAQSNLALLHLDMARYKEAAGQYRQILENNRRQLGPAHVYVGIAIGHLATALTEDGLGAEAMPLVDEMLEVFRNAVSEKHPYYAKGLMIHGDILYYEYPGQAAIMLERSVDIFRQVVGHNHPNLAMALTSLGRALFASGENAAAEAALHEALEIQRQALPSSHTNTIWTLINLGRVLTDQGRAGEAEPLLQEAAEVSADALPAGHWRRITARVELAACLMAIGQEEAAVDDLEQILAALQGRTDFHAIQLQERARELLNLTGG